MINVSEANLAEFSGRLLFFRHQVKGLSRINLAEQTNKGSPQTAASVLKAEDIRGFERAEDVANSSVRGRLARVMGVPRVLLDPDAQNHQFVTTALLDMARGRAWDLATICHVWKVVTGRVKFSGYPASGDLRVVLEAVAEDFPGEPRIELLLDEFRCTHCWYWEGQSQAQCPLCGAVH